MSTKVSTRLWPCINRMGVASLVLLCAVAASASLWLVDSGADRFDRSLEMRRQSLQGFESLRYRVLQFHDREETALEEERANIDRSYARLLEDWQKEPPILGLAPVLRLRDSRLELVLIATEVRAEVEER